MCFCPYPILQQYTEHHSQTQYPPQVQKTYPTQLQQPQISQPRQLQLPSNQPPPRPTQLLAQPISKPNNKLVQLTKNKWHVFLNYQELNKSTLKYYFPLPFVDQVLDTLGKKCFSFLDWFSGYNQIQITL
jgi:hypothetical protein